MATLSAAPGIAARTQSPANSRAAMLERVATDWLLELRAALAALDLTPAQFRLLSAAAWLTSRGDGVRQSEISAYAHADAVMTSEVLRTLETRGLVTRAPHPVDRRARSITVTPAGGQLADRGMRLVDSIESNFFERGTADFRSLGKALKRGGRGDQSR